MIKAGIYKEESTNQTMFCYEICPPDYIKVWKEDKEGSECDDGWWRCEITPQKFHWLVDEWNNGHIAKVYPHWWEDTDIRQTHINSLLQLSHDELMDAFNYFAYVLPHYRWTTELHLNSDLRPLWYRGKIVKFEETPHDEAMYHNANEADKKVYDRYLWGQTDSEAIAKTIKEYI